ncbi:response regulator receiver domain-containing protein [Mariniflexile fucanivorans]|uniref:Response regulator receiver domain-containing protein n=1 Tax=Mariniflexile fucanivorans TaxID=264023 RepID=A0A4R1RB49_9FLAO|nr:response regulator [Mariniflexile fucanivorans]TCL62840.1 response regulator receiver domain-containing protein [Mariniflexile fucanivorans]
MGKIVILCVDDEKIILNSIKVQLKENYGNSFLYETAESAQEALDIIDEIMTDNQTKLIVISDWLMPVVKGDEFLIKVHSKYPKSLKIMLTGQVDEESIKRTEKEGNLYKCIRKPWMASELISCINSGMLLI